MTLPRVRSLSWAVAAAVVLLAVLATLQYRWVGQLTEAEELRLKSSARERAEQYAQGFDRELTRAFVWLRAEPDAVAETGSGRYAERYERWLRGSAMPAVVRDVFVALPASAGDSFELWRFDASRGAFARAEWPALLTTTHDHLKEWASAQRAAEAPTIPRTGERPAAHPGERWPRRADWVDDAVPALVVPLRTPFGDPRAPRPPRPLGVTIVQLDLDVIRAQFLPQLAHRHLRAANAEELEYDATIVSNDKPDPGHTTAPQTVYASDASAASHTADATTTMFELRLDELGPDDMAAFGPPPGGPAPPGASASSPWRPDWTRRGALPRVSDNGRWRLQLVHHAGSIDRLVAGLRARHLAVSFGVLALLGLSLVLIVTSSQRARRLAERQIEFVAGVSHELRTPVSVICAAGENLADGLVTRPEDVRQHGALVRDEGRRLANTLEQVLEFAGSDASRVPFQREPVDVTRVVHSALDACQAQAQSQGFEIECQLEPDLPRVYGDAAALGRALRNLIDNALKYSDGSRWIGVRAARENAYVRVTVTDRGLGIPKAEVGHVFEAFYRGREARARQIQGNGLGLSLVERIVRAHGGRVEVQSAPGQGSSFTLLLRVAPEPATQTSLETHERAHPAG